MSVYIGSARIDENGNAAGGRAGDSGREVAIEPYYTPASGWTVLRPKSASVADKLAYAMKRACANNNIGYDQSARETLYAAASKVGFDPGKVTVKCETDCSALVRVCLAYAGILVGCMNTATEERTLMATGQFKKVSLSNGLRTGDVLITGKVPGHTVIVTQGNEPAQTVTVSTKLSKTPQRTGTVTAGALNVRTWAGKSYPLVKFTKALPYGTTVGICGVVYAADGAPWYYIKVGDHYGFASARYIK